MVHAFTSFLLEVRQQIYHIIQFHYCLYPPLHFSSFGMCFPGGTFVSFDVMSNGMKNRSVSPCILVRKSQRFSSVWPSRRPDINRRTGEGMRDGLRYIENGK